MHCAIYTRFVNPYHVIRPYRNHATRPCRCLDFCYNLHPSDRSLYSHDNCRHYSQDNCHIFFFIITAFIFNSQRIAVALCAFKLLNYRALSAKLFH
jgi:hypothetical protein